MLEKLKLQDVHVHSGISCIMSHNSNHYPFMVVVPVMEAELIGINDSLKNKNSSGYYAISNKIRRLGSHVIRKPLPYIFNKSLSLAIFLERLQYAIIKPILKNGDRSRVANYGPISLWTAFAKLFVIAIFRTVNQHFQVHNLLIPEQYGFRKGLSTTEAT
jgi:hypothetical protein